MFSNFEWPSKEKWQAFIQQEKWVWRVWRDLRRKDMLPLCRRCGNKVSFHEVSPNYYAVCDYHKEDLYRHEVEFINFDMWGFHKQWRRK